MGSIPATFWLNSVAAGRPLALEPEGGGRLTTLNYTKMGWGYVFCLRTHILCWLGQG